MRPPSVSGFTLVELLVVIAIVSVLAAILFPVFIHVRAKAWQVHCLSNVRQIGAAFLVYASDNDNCVPPSMTDQLGTQFLLPWQAEANITWWDIILPYLGNSVPTLYCPATKSYVPPYLVNAWLTAPGHLWLGEINQPAATILVTEGIPPTVELEGVPGAPNTLGVHPGSGSYHHHGKMNAVFADGHAKLLGPDVLWGKPEVWLLQK